MSFGSINYSFFTTNTYSDDLHQSNNYSKNSNNAFNTIRIGLDTHSTNNITSVGELHKFRDFGTKVEHIEPICYNTSGGKVEVTKQINVPDMGNFHIFEDGVPTLLGNKHLQKGGMVLDYTNETMILNDVKYRVEFVNDLPYVKIDVPLGQHDGRGEPANSHHTHITFDCTE